eukprot:GHVU01040885.1.p2 GENE.GHVU01040885.1~~GHVU01040885.1.p2  ORF type:complete len:591 (+),score=41.33 GHVU01040885.1:305-2077(+)
MIVFKNHYRAQTIRHTRMASSYVAYDRNLSGSNAIITRYAAHPAPHTVRSIKSINIVPSDVAERLTMVPTSVDDLHKTLLIPMVDGHPLIPSCFGNTAVYTDNIATMNANFFQDRDPDEYKEQIRVLYSTKSCPPRREAAAVRVDGSGRFVIVPCWTIPVDTVLLPSRAMAKMTVPLVSVCRGARVAGTTVKWAIVSRPPELWAYGAQPMRVKTWGIDALGIHPANCKKYAGDFDGDEMQFMPVVTPLAEDECGRFVHRETSDLPDATVGWAGGPSVDDWMESTTMPLTAFVGKYENSRSGVLDSASRFVDRSHPNFKRVGYKAFDKMFDHFYYDNLSWDDFTAECHAAAESATAQNKFLGCVGHATREFKSLSLCVRVDGDVATSTVSRLPPVNLNAVHAPLVALHTMCKLSAKVYQTMLDKHHADATSTVNFDPLMHIINGRGASFAGTTTPIVGSVPLGVIDGVYIYTMTPTEALTTGALMISGHVLSNVDWSDSAPIIHIGSVLMAAVARYVGVQVTNDEATLAFMCLWGCCIAAPGFTIPAPHGLRKVTDKFGALTTLMTISGKCASFRGVCDTTNPWVKGLISE